MAEQKISVSAVTPLDLPAYITASLNTPFIWGRNDCVLFVARWAQMRTGRDWLADVEPWFSMRAAQRIVQELGGLEAAMDRKFSRIEPNFAGDGDIAFHQEALRLFVGRYICGPGENGLVFFERTEAKCAWRCS